MDALENEPQSARWQVRYTLTDADLTAFRRFDMKRRRVWRIISVTVVLAFLLMFFLFLTELAFLGLASVTLISLGVTLAIVAAGIGLGNFGMQRLLKKASRAAGEITQEFFSDKFVGTDARYRTEYRWRSFTDIVRGMNATYYYLSRTRAIIVPDRAFSTPEEATACAEFAAEHWRSLLADRPRPTASSPFAITFTMDDAMIAHQIYSRFGRRRWLRKRLAYILMPSIMAIVLVWTGVQTAFQTGASVWDAIVPLTFATLILAWLYWGYAPAQVVARTRKAGGSEPQTLRLAPDGMALIDSKATSQVRWESVKRVEEDGKLIYIDLEGGSWFTIPIAAFLDNEHHKAFVDAIAAYRQGRQPAALAGASWPPAPEG